MKSGCTLTEMLGKSVGKCAKQSWATLSCGTWPFMIFVHSCVYDYGT